MCLADVVMYFFHCSGPITSDPICSPSRRASGLRPVVALLPFVFPRLASAAASEAAGCLPQIFCWWTTGQKQGNEKPGEEGQSGQILPPYAGRTAVANRIQPPTFEGIHLVPNLGQPITQTAIRGRRGWARTDRRCGGVDPRKLHGRSRQQGSRRRCLQESLRGDHLRRGPPIQGSPVEV